MNIIKNRITIFIIIIIIIGILLTYFINSPQKSIVIWSVILVIITALYVTATYKILQSQDKAEKLKWFIQVNIFKYKASWSDNKITDLELEFLNVSPGLGYNSKIRIFKGDSLIELVENDYIIIEKNIGILTPDYPNIQKFKFKNPIEFKNGIIKLRVDLKTMNPLKILNILSYLITITKYKTGNIELEISLLDFCNGVKDIDFKYVKNKSLYPKRS